MTNQDYELIKRSVLGLTSGKLKVATVFHDREDLVNIVATSILEKRSLERYDSVMRDRDSFIFHICRCTLIDIIRKEKYRRRELSLTVKDSDTDDPWWMDFLSSS